jgi:hypothetical protein
MRELTNTSILMGVASINKKNTSDQKNQAKVRTNKKNESTSPGHTQTTEGSTLLKETLAAPETKVIDLTTTWPLKPPKEVFPRIDDCHVVFRDPAMATCHLGAFGGNFGDFLGPDIVKRIVEYKFGCSARSLDVLDFASNETGELSANRPCLWSVGSVWRNVRANDHVWGTGSLILDREFGLCKGTKPNGETNLNITVYSARGPKTIHQLKKHCRNRGLKFITADGGVSSKTSRIIPRGDAGFLIPFLFPEFQYQQDKADIEKCLILHFYDQEDNGRVDLPEEALLPVVQPWPTMVGNITRCKMLVSSSLHGVILADAFGVPVRWMHKATSVSPDKFYDYFQSFPRGHWNTSFDGGIKQALDTTRANIPVPLDAEYRSEYAQMIIKSFPFDLFTTKSVQPTNSDEGKEDLVSELLDLQRQRGKDIYEEVKTVVGKIVKTPTTRENALVSTARPQSRHVWHLLAATKLSSTARLGWHHKDKETKSNGRLSVPVGSIGLIPISVLYAVSSFSVVAFALAPSPSSKLGISLQAIPDLVYIQRRQFLHYWSRTLSH